MKIYSKKGGIIMTLNVKGRNIEINDTLAAAYKEAVFLDMAEIDALAFLSEEWNTNYPENRFYEFSDDELSKIVEKRAYSEIKLRMEDLLCRPVPEELRALFE